MAFQPTEHPVLALPSQERMLEFKKRGKKGLDELVELFKKREELIQLERNDPLDMDSSLLTGTTQMNCGQMPRNY